MVEVDNKVKKGFNLNLQIKKIEKEKWINKIPSNTFIFYHIVQIMIISECK